MLPVSETMSNEISSFRQSRNKLNIFDFVERTKFYNRIVRHCCRLWQQSRMLLRQSRTFLRQCCLLLRHCAAGVNGALSGVLTAATYCRRRRYIAAVRTLLYWLTGRSWRTVLQRYSCWHGRVQNDACVHGPWTQAVNKVSVNPAHTVTSCAGKKHCTTILFSTQPVNTRGFFTGALHYPWIGPSTQLVFTGGKWYMCHSVMCLIKPCSHRKILLQPYQIQANFWVC